MKRFFITTITVIFLFTSCNKKNNDIDNDKIGIYQKEKLPNNLTYKIIEDNSDDVLEKNQITVELSTKITEGQIATLAEKFYNSKNEQRRFYIFYLLPGMKNGETASWATSHFDPELKIEILGSNGLEDKSTEILATIKGHIIGKWHEEAYTSVNYVIYEENEKPFLMTFLGTDKGPSIELKSKKNGGETRFDYKESSHNGEYFILNSKGELEFYNEEGKNFTTGTIME